MLDVIKFNQDGFAIVHHIINDAIIERVISEINNVPQTKAVKRKHQQVYAIRDLLNMIVTAKEIAWSAVVTELVELVIAEAVITRGLFFDKIPVANWTVDWHQDLIVAVKERKMVAGFEAWSVKSKINHVMPPIPVLENMLTVRVHLDDIDEFNGALLVIPGSHTHGRLSDEEIEQWKLKEKILCSLPKGSALIMRPLLLHSSYAGSKPSHRRVLHLEYSSDALPGGLAWYGA
jgi:ectoine hydroxylase-related dioxygenase (phytanoyl-CoA dioxygenase family)